MEGNRLEALKSLVERNPADSFARYGLAMEYARSGDLEGAVQEFRTLIDADPGYVAAYYHAGQALERLGRSGDARQVYEQGIREASRKGDQHTRDEIQAALDLMG